MQPGRQPSGRRLVAIDVLVALWVALCIGLGVAVASEVRELRTIADAVSSAGQAVEATGRALSSLSGLPGVGGDLAGAGGEVEQAGREAIGSGRSTRDTIGDLSTLLLVSIAVVPATPLLAVYVPWRLARRRERRRG